MPLSTNISIIVYFTLNTYSVLYLICIFVTVRHLGSLLCILVGCLRIVAFKYHFERRDIKNTKYTLHILRNVQHFNLFSAGIPNKNVILLI